MIRFNKIINRGIGPVAQRVRIVQPLRASLSIPKPLIQKDLFQQPQGFVYQPIQTFSNLLGKDPLEIERTNKLHHIVKQEIKMAGNAPMTLARFMELALMHPEYGYYSTKKQIFNKGGDFTTSPEISQMFGEMLGIWLTTAFNNYDGLKGVENKADVKKEAIEQTQAGVNLVVDATTEPKQKEEKFPGSNKSKKSNSPGKSKQKKQEQSKDQNIIPNHLQSINIVEIGPGTGLMMCDILRTLKQFTGNLKNIQVNLIEASPNLRKTQQDQILKYLQHKCQIFLSYDIKSGEDERKAKRENKHVPGQQDGQFGFDDAKSNVDKFMNKDQNFSISWYSSLKDYHQDYLNDRLALVEQIKNMDDKKKQAELMNNPCFLIAHELFDALPIHQFHYNERREWCEKVVTIDESSNELRFSITDGPTDNTQSKLQPEKFFSQQAQQDLRPGDSIEICPDGIQFTKDICNLLELSKGMALVIDYGENHSFSNSFRGLKNHQLVKDDQEILDNVGNIDLTSYVNFQQISQVAESNKDIRAEGPMPQGQFLECMGIAHRVEQLQNIGVKNIQQKEALFKTYERLCSPDEMGAIYKIMFLGDKKAGEVYPFLSQETIRDLESYK